MVLQMIASHSKSGILELQDEEEKAVIFMTDGFVDAVSIPRSDHLLGSRLVSNGTLSATELRKILISLDRTDGEFLGITLIRSGLVQTEAVLSALEEQAYENTLELSNWVQGTFRFLEPDVVPHFPVSPRINVQHLLLETSRRLDEGQRPKRAKKELPIVELCVACSAGCDADHKQKYLKDGICLWRNMPVVIREEIFSPVARQDPLFDEEEVHTADLPFL
jgi:hypothetical protein